MSHLGDFFSEQKNVSSWRGSHLRVPHLGVRDCTYLNLLIGSFSFTFHFDPKYRDLPFENRGIFKWSPNAMYVFAIGIPFSFAVATGSQSMFVVAIYTYISIWLHYFCTEKEDIKVIYGIN